MEEYDQYQHYFYDDHNLDEDFFKSTAPSEDIWKKFELVPTPPLSPVRILEGSGPSPGDRLEWVSQFIGQDDEQEGQCKLNAEETLENLSSIIIQDCMWSSFSASQHALRPALYANPPTTLAAYSFQVSIVSASRGLRREHTGAIKGAERREVLMKKPTAN
uniref:MYCL proto-oncogene, bHLH transcription factor b n=1 Tax=Sinocyclocheilus anshuiensis TaxID=1608454 RepID=A0A671M1W3_9TELE